MGPAAQEWAGAIGVGKGRMSSQGGPWRLADAVRPVAVARREETNASSGSAVTDDRMVRRVVASYLGAVLVAAVIALVGLYEGLW